MSQYRPKIHKHIMRAILTAQRGHSCAFRAQVVSDSDAEDSVLEDFATAFNIDDTSLPFGAHTLFAIGSGMKLIINFAFYRVIEDGNNVLLDDKVRDMMRRAWNKPAFTLYNELREHRGLQRWSQPRRLKPSIRQLMTHTYAYPAHQRGLFGPDGRFVMSEGTFGQTFAALVDSIESTGRGNYCYSNWNTMLLGLILVHATNTSLAQALKAIVLDYCQMNNTILDSQGFMQARAKIAHPHITTTVFGPIESSLINFHDDNAALAIGGGYSCVEDMTNLLKHMLKPALSGDQLMVETFFRTSDTIVDGGVHKASFLSGIYAPLDSDVTGSESFERLPGSSIFTLGRHAGESIQAISKAGAVRGFANHFYVVTSQSLVMAVMTNASGIADSSQMLAQYLLQEILDLKPPLDNIESRAAEMFTKNLDFLKEHATCYRTHQGFSSNERENLPGHYVEAITQQRIVIAKIDSDSLSAYIEEGCGNPRRRTSMMKLIKIAPHTITFLPDPKELAIDAHHAWRNFGLIIKTRSTGEVYALAKDESLGQSDGSEAGVVTLRELFQKAQ